MPVGLLARGSSVALQPSRSLLPTISGIFGVNSPLTVAGAASASTLQASHRVPCQSHALRACDFTVTFTNAPQVTPPVNLKALSSHRGLS
mgnify:CR=1 FL=1